MHINTYRPSTELAPTDYYYEREEQFYHIIFQHAPRAIDAPFVVVSNSIAKAKFIHEECRKINRQAVIKMYSSESTADERADLLDVNKNWTGVHILIYTSTISAGCSFEQAHFTRLFAYFTNRSTDYKTAIQMMGRIRNISSREYHIHINSAASNLPSDRASIETILRTANGASSAGFEHNLTTAPRFINAIGEEDFRVKDLYYHSHINNIVAKCQSKNSFLKLFVGLRVQSGAIISGIDPTTLPADVAREMRIKKNAALADIKQARINDMLAAPGIDTDTADRLKNEEYLNGAEKASLAVHSLAECYHVDADKITADFIKKYDDSRVKRAWYNLTRLCASGEGASLNTSAANYIRINSLAADSGTLSRAHKNMELLKVMFALDIINIIFDDMCKDMNKFVMRYIAKPILVDRAKAVIEYLTPHMKTIAYLFDMHMSKLSNIATRDLREQLKFINAILNHTFEITIKLDMSDRSMFYLRPSDKFIFDQQTNKWKLPV